MRSSCPALVLVAVSVAPLAFLACDALKKKDGDAGAEPPVVVATTPTATATATPTPTASATTTAMATAPPGTRIVKLSDGGTALVNDAGQIVDAGRLVFTLPSGTPSAFVIPSTIPVPSQITIPSAIVVPSGLGIPPFPPGADAGKKQ